jgi:hypothetical protein
LHTDPISLARVVKCWIGRHSVGCYPPTAWRRHACRLRTGGCLTSAK